MQEFVKTIFILQTSANDPFYASHLFSYEKKKPDTLIIITVSHFSSLAAGS